MTTQLAPMAPTVEVALERARQRLLRDQHELGYWKAELETKEKELKAKDDAQQALQAQQKQLQETEIRP